MLSKRTSILFEPEEYQHLVKLASENNTSVGELVRQAVREMYLQQPVYSQEEVLLKMKNLAQNSNFKLSTPKQTKHFIEQGRA
jgi:hypothetical protein